MFKEKSFEEELFANMQSNLNKNASSVDSKKLESAKEYIKKSAILLKNNKMEKLANDLLTCLEGLK